MNKLRHKVVMALALTTSVVGAFPHTAEAKDKENPKPWSVEWYQKRHHPSVEYWDKVAWCETHKDWKNGGYWAGGLGIARSTWVGYGGRDFASVPNKASKAEQIVIANRIAVFGYQTKNEFRTYEDRLNNKPFFRPPAGFGGWGCIRLKPHLKPPKASLSYGWKHHG